MPRNDRKGDRDIWVFYLFICIFSAAMWAALLCLAVAANCQSHPRRSSEIQRPVLVYAAHGVKTLQIWVIDWEFGGRWRSGEFQTSLFVRIKPELLVAVSFCLKRRQFHPKLNFQQKGKQKLDMPENEERFSLGFFSSSISIFV